MTETSSNSLQILIAEFKNISPEITHAALFKKNGEILASSEITAEEQIKKLISSFNGVGDQAEIIGGIETLTIQGANGQLNILSMNNHYLATVSSRTADQKIVKSLTNVVVPTVVKLMDQITTAQQSENKLPKIGKLEDNISEKTVLSIEATEHNYPIPESPAEFSSEPLLPHPPVTQFMVEKIGGFLVSPDIAKVDVEVIAKWADLYGDKEIKRIHVETLEGRGVLCNFKPIKEASNNGKGIIQIPEKIMQALQTSKGKLVMVKPVIE
jgi:predicted regulator of Ras-like GTPase activity (Roadblock/LC7/MglB family)